MQSNAERQAALRERRLRLGLSEVRGIWLPAALHATVKAQAKRLFAEMMRKSMAKSPKKTQ